MRRYQRQTKFALVFRSTSKDKQRKQRLPARLPETRFAAPWRLSARPLVPLQQLVHVQTKETQIMKKILLLSVLVLMGSVAQAQSLAPSETLIKNATVLTVTRGTLTNTDVLLRNGKIAAVGKNLNASANARVIDATGKFVMPGIIDCHSHSMLDTINEGTLAVTSMVRTEDVLNPTDIDLYRELAGGVTTLNLLHGSANPIGGLNSVVKIKYGRPAAEFLFPGAMPGIKFALGENEIGRASCRERV